MRLEKAGTGSDLGALGLSGSVIVEPFDQGNDIKAIFSRISQNPVGPRKNVLEKSTTLDDLDLTGHA